MELVEDTMNVCGKCATSEEFVLVVMKVKKLFDGVCDLCHKFTPVFER